MNYWKLKFEIILKPGMNVIKSMQDLCAKHYKTPLRDVKGVLNIKLVMPCVCIRRLNIVKIPVLSNLICRYSAIPVDTPASFFKDINMFLLKGCMEKQRN